MSEMFTEQALCCCWQHCYGPITIRVCASILIVTTTVSEPRHSWTPAGPQASSARLSALLDSVSSLSPGPQHFLFS